ncbi:MAG: Fur family transcriptional regulator [Candidatus Dormibacteria bacterium]
MSPTYQPTERSTRQKRALLAVLRNLDRFVSAQELHRLLTDQGTHIGIATVYLHLRKLTQAGTVETTVSDDGETRYQMCPATGHHHHMVCSVCGTSRDIGSDLVESWARETAARMGFSLSEHIVELRGVCPACQTEQ